MKETYGEILEQELQEERQKVEVSSISFSVREVKGMYEEDEIILDPAYQRNYRWSKDKAARFIESIFLSLPIPPVFVAKNKTSFTMEVIDGVQRINSVLWFMSDDKDFLNGIGEKTPLRLPELKNLGTLSGKTYSELPENIQRYFSRQPLQFVILSDTSDYDVRHNLFSRLNSGSVALTPQEVRRVTYKGDFMTFIEDLSQEGLFLSTLKVKSIQEKDGTIQEEVLKFFAYKNYRRNLKNYISDFLDKYCEGIDINEIYFDYETEKECFLKTCLFFNNLFEGKHFNINNGMTPLVKFEACLVAVAEIYQSGKTPKKLDDLSWLEDREFQKLCSNTSRKKLSDRISYAKQYFLG